MNSMSIKERPILFKGEMVRAILDGNKTQTRRVMKQQPPLGYRVLRQLAQWTEFENDVPPLGKWSLACPFGKPGDQLWVRESFYINLYPYDNERLPKNPEPKLLAELLENQYFMADPLPEFEGEQDLIRWRPSIHMPRWASRITLEIKNVRVERLQDISEEDAKAEGIVLNAPAICLKPNAAMFRHLWTNLGGDWESNPWVWVIDFEVVK